MTRIAAKASTSTGHSSRPEVAEAAVVAGPDRVRGEVPVAYVVLRGPLDVAELEARCREKLASFKVPRWFEAVDKLPRNALGKVQKHLLSGPRMNVNTPNV